MRMAREVLTVEQQDSGSLRNMSSWVLAEMNITRQEGLF